MTNAGRSRTSAEETTGHDTDVRLCGTDPLHELALLEGKAGDPSARQFCKDVQGWVRDACQAHHRLARGPWRAKAAKKKAGALRRQLRKLCRACSAPWCGHSMSTRRSRLTAWPFWAAR